MRVSSNILLLLLSFDPLLLLSHAVSNYLVFYFPLFAFHPFPSCLPKCILFYIIFHLLKKTKDLQIIVCHTCSQGRARLWSSETRLDGVRVLWSSSSEKVGIFAEWFILTHFHSLHYTTHWSAWSYYAVLQCSAYSKRVPRTNCALRIKKCAPRISSGIYFLSTS